MVSSLTENQSNLTSQETTNDANNTQHDVTPSWFHLNHSVTISHVHPQLDVCQFDNQRTWIGDAIILDNQSSALPFFNQKPASKMHQTPDLL